MTRTHLQDDEARETASTVFDRNLVVTAGAGTGKTTVLINRLFHLVLREPDPLDITEIVALTFTNKAAAELKGKLRERLDAVLRLDLSAGPAAIETIDEREVRDALSRYGLSKDDADRRADTALAKLEQAQIGTIHSFAAHLLRLHPAESGVDPYFQPDEGNLFKDYFKKEWALWLDAELGENAPNAEIWKKALARVRLADIETFARELACENVPLDLASGRATEDSTLKEWFAQLEGECRRLLAAHPEKNLKIERLLSSSVEIFGSLRDDRTPVADTLSDKDLSEIRGAAPSASKGWEDDLLAAKRLVRIAKQALDVDPEALSDLLSLLVPLARDVRKRFAQKGALTFDALIVRARDLLRDHPAVRDQIKRRTRAILVDEFQDTDPIQYEILLYLAEAPGKSAPTWGKVALAPGKIFIVGDPKQSIYAFRRADIEAYHKVIRETLVPQGAYVLHLSTNFRSRGEILRSVNGIFSRLIIEREGLQPPYVSLFPSPLRDDPGGTPGVEVRWIASDSGGEPLSADEARETEAESLAEWLSQSLASKRFKAGDVALLFRTLTQVDPFLEALRRRSIEYVIEGEKHFFKAQEVIDAVNLLRVVDNPEDRVAWVGLLRSPTGGLTDGDILRLAESGWLTAESSTVRADDTDVPVAYRELVFTIEALRGEVRALPVADAVARCFEQVPLVPLAAASRQGEQGAANVMKILRLADDWGLRPDMTLRRFITLLEERIREVEEEGESPLAEQSLDAVKILTIHKAKGLEFPIVILPSCQQGTIGAREETAWARPDWTTNLVGLKCGSLRNGAALYLEDRRLAREEEERRRLAYVAMTRARETLILSGAESGTHGRSEALSQILRAAVPDLGNVEGEISIGEGRIRQEFVSAPDPSRASGKKRRKSASLVDWKVFANGWEKRRATRTAVIDRERFTSPSRMKETAFPMESVTPEDRPTRDDAIWVGRIAHRILERLDFGDPEPDFEKIIREALLRDLAPEMAARSEKIKADLLAIFSALRHSEVWEEISRAQILARELPFLMPGDGQVVEGIIDVVYERAGRRIVADYKTDQIREDEMERRSEMYRAQGQIYTRAAERCLGSGPYLFKLVYLRLGRSYFPAGD